MSIQLTLDKLEEAMEHLSSAIAEELHNDRRAELTQLVTKMQHLYTVYTNGLKRAAQQMEK